MQACRDLLTLQLLPAVGDAHTRQVSAEAGHQLEKLDARSFPLGFTTGGTVRHDWQVGFPYKDKISSETVATSVIGRECSRYNNEPLNLIAALYLRLSFSD